MHCTLLINQKFSLYNNLHVQIYINRNLLEERVKTKFLPDKAIFLLNYNFYNYIIHYRAN